MPYIFAGLRVATATVIGLVTVTALIGLGGLGQQITYGFNIGYNTPIIVGLVLSVALAAVADLLLVAAQRLLVPWSRSRPTRSAGLMSFFAHVFGWFTTSANWSGDQGIPVLFWHQLKLSVAVVLTALVLGGGLGVVLGHTGRGGLVAVNAANAFRAVPTLALLTLLAIQPSISLKWNGFLAAWLALTALAIPPILTNTYVGMREVDADVRDAAKAMGLTGGQVLRTVEAPLAVPFVMAGVRTASIEVVATSTLAAYVSYTDLGHLRHHRPQHQRLGRGLQRRAPGGRHGGDDGARARAPYQGAHATAAAAPDGVPPAAVRRYRAAACTFGLNSGFPSGLLGFQLPDGAVTVSPTRPARAPYRSKRFPNASHPFPRRRSVGRPGPNLRTSGRDGWGGD